MQRFLVPAAIAATMLATLLSAPPVQASLLSIADNYIGLHEKKHRGKLRSILGVDPRRTPWCGAFATTVIRKGGRTPPRGSMMARSWMHYGRAVKLSQARPGDVVVLSRHVGFFQSRSKGRVCLIGGNQSNQVQVSCYAAGKVRGVRR